MITHSEWRVPQWHTDYGDVKGELEHLRDLANAIDERLPQLSVMLCKPEMGVIYLQIIAPANKVLAEVHSIQQSSKNQRRYGVFLFPNTPLEAEDYALTTTAVIGLLSAGNATF